jgi:hypothetical protein
MYCSKRDKYVIVNVDAHILILFLHVFASDINELLTLEHHDCKDISSIVAHLQHLYQSI